MPSPSKSPTKGLSPGRPRHGRCRGRTFVTTTVDLGPSTHTGFDTNGAGIADEAFAFGQSPWLPVAGFTGL